MTDAAAWNASVKVGAKVRYWPVRGRPECRDSVTRSEAWDLPSDQTVVKIEGASGGVSTAHLEVLAEEVNG